MADQTTIDELLQLDDAALMNGHRAMAEEYLEQCADLQGEKEKQLMSRLNIAALRALPPAATAKTRLRGKTTGRQDALLRSRGRGEGTPCNRPSLLPPVAKEALVETSSAAHTDGRETSREV